MFDFDSMIYYLFYTGDVWPADHNKSASCHENSRILSEAKLQSKSIGMIYIGHIFMLIDSENYGQAGQASFVIFARKTPSNHENHSVFCSIHIDMPEQFACCYGFGCK